MRRFCCLLLCLLLTLSLVPARTEALESPPPPAVLMDADTGEILFEKNADRRMLIASTTKLMTALVALELGGAVAGHHRNCRTHGGGVVHEYCGRGRG
mgnify:CR=1 FL=1